MCRLLGRPCRWCTKSHDDIHTKSDKLCGELREPIELVLSETCFDQNVPSIDVSKLPHSLPK